MSFLTQIKLSPVTSLADARFAAASGIMYMGFCLDHTNRNFILPIRVKEILEWTTGSHAVGEFGDQGVEEIKEISDLLGMDAVVVNNTILPDEIHIIGKPVIKVVDFNKLTEDEILRELQAYEEVTEAFQVIGSNWQKHEALLMDICGRYRIFWNIDIHSDQLRFVAEKFKPFAISINPGTEEKTGLKEFDSLNEILEILSSDRLD